MKKWLFVLVVASMNVVMLTGCAEYSDIDSLPLVV